MWVDRANLATYVETRRRAGRAAERHPHSHGRGQHRHGHRQLAAAGRCRGTHAYRRPQPWSATDATAHANTPANRGFSIVELMVAVTIAVITGIVVLQVLSIYEARRRTVTVGNDAEMGAAVGLYMVESEVRMAGAGLHLPDRPALRRRHQRQLRRRDDRRMARRFRSCESRTAAQAPTGSTSSAATRRSAWRRARSPRRWPRRTRRSGSRVPSALRTVTCSWPPAQDGVKICTLMQMTANPASVGTQLDARAQFGGLRLQPGGLRRPHSPTRSATTSAMPCTTSAPSACAPSA